MLPSLQRCLIIFALVGSVRAHADSVYDELVALNDRVNATRKVLISEVGVNFAAERERIDRAAREFASVRAQLTDELRSQGNAFTSVSDNLTDAESWNNASRAAWEVESALAKAQSLAAADLDGVEQAFARFTEVLQSMDPTAKPFVAWSDVLRQQRPRFEALKRKAAVASAPTVVLTVPSEFVRPIGALFTITDPAAGARVEIQAAGVWRGEASLRLHTVDDALRFKFELVECDAAESCRGARRLQANGPLTVRVKGPRGSGMVVIEPEVNRGGVSFPGRITDRLGEPPAEALLPMRDVTWWTLATRTQSPFVNAWQGFTELPDSFFMYVRTAPPGTRESPTLKVGEPLLKLGDVYLRANGQEFTFDWGALGKLKPSDFLTTERPARVVLPQPLPASGKPDFDKDELDDEQISSRPELRAFVAARRKAFACGVDAWAKRDPSGKSFDYDVVSHDARGRVTKVERMVDTVQREINAACGTDKLFKQAVPLKNKLRAQWMKEIARRFR